MVKISKLMLKHVADIYGKDVTAHFKRLARRAKVGSDLHLLLERAKQKAYAQQMRCPNISKLEFGSATATPHRFTVNRKRFADLIYRMRCFDEQEIVERFRKEQHGDIEIDGSQHVIQYLRELRGQGALIYTNGKYHVPKRHESRLWVQFPVIT
jgi:hypothetical protein